MIKFKEFLAEQELLTELLHLHKVFTKKGKEFLDNLLTGDVFINLKIDTSAFIIKKDSNGLSYWGREGAQELDKIKRAGSDIWEKFIGHIENQKWEKLPNDITIATEMYNKRISTIVKWDIAPKGGMIISWIKLKGKILPLNDPMYERVSSILQIAPPPVIHAGKLNTKQKKLIRQLAENPDVITGEQFAAEILSIFTLKPAHAFLAGDFIEGVVIYAQDGSTYKITDNFFTAVNKEKNENKSNEFFELLSSTAYNNLKSAFSSVTGNKRSMDKIMRHTDKDDRYIAFISALTGTIIQKVAKDMKKVDDYKTDVESGRYSNISSDFVSSGMRSLISKYWWSEDLFRVLLYGIRREKKRVHIKSGLTADRKNLINGIVSELKALGIL